MSESNYAALDENGVCTNILVLDPEVTDPGDFAALIGVASLVPLADYADGAWGIGDSLIGGRVRYAHPPAAPADPDADPDAPGVATPNPAEVLLNQVNAGLDAAVTAGWLSGKRRDAIVANDVPAPDPADPTDPAGSVPADAAEVKSR